MLKQPVEIAEGAPSPVRVLFDHRIFVEQSYGGVSHYFAALAGQLPALGVVPRICAPLHVNAYLKRLPARMVWGKSVPRSGAAMAIGRRLGKLFDPIAARLHKAQVVHETYYGSAPSAPAGVPTVLTVYDMIHELFPDTPGSERVIAWKKAAIARADWIFCISESTRRDLLAHYPDAADRSSVTLLGFEPAKAAADLPPADRPYILYVGQRPGYKNFSGLLDAFASSPLLRRDFDLVCAGAGAFTPAERSAIAAAGVAHQIRQLDADDRRLQALYRGAAVFVYPSLYEGFGIPPLEAMAADCPVVTMRCSSIPEVCGKAAEYCTPGDVGSLRDAIEAVVASPSRGAALRTAGRARLAQFSWRRCAAETAVIYRSLT